jgi:P4 family phage/plasmid primase-like protien
MQTTDAVARSCHALFEPGQVTEVRILGVPGKQGFTFNAGGWFNDWGKLSKLVAKYENRAPFGIYTTINPLHPACLSRTSNEIVERIKQTTSDRDVQRRAWLPIDIDPQRPSGVSASQSELESARELAGRIVEYLENTSGFQFPQGLRAHSGNGIHLLYRINLPNDDASKALVQEALQALADKFNSPAVHVDTTLFNASRILKLWGTVTRKGMHDESRPHRRSCLWTPVSSPADLEIVNVEQLRALANTKRKAKPARSTKKTKSKDQKDNSSELFDLDAWIAENNIAYKSKEPFDGSGIRYMLNECLFDASHTGSSAILGRAPNGAIFYRCQHDSCAKKQWADVRGLFPNTAKTKADPTDESLTPWDIANQLIDDYYLDDELNEIILRRHREQFYLYDFKSNFYQPVSNDHMKVAVTRWLGENDFKNTSRSVNDVLNSLASVVTVSESIDIPFVAKIDPETRSGTSICEKRNWMTLTNGILDVGRVLAGENISDAFMSLTTDWFAINGLDFPLPLTEREADCEKWLAFLDEVLEEDGERVQVLQEMFGYCFFQDTRFERFFILQGQGNNGKSVVLSLLMELLGPANVSALSLDQLADPRLRLELYQKLANICTDLPEMDRVEEGIIKRMTSGEPIIADRKYKEAVRFSPTAKIIFSTNPLPRFADTSLGIWRRMVLIPFNYVVPPSRVNPGLADELKAELPGIFLWAIQGALRLAQNGNFSSSAVCEEANRAYKMDCFPVYTFLDECTRLEGEIKTTDLWRAYKKWCRAFGLVKIKPLHTFIRDVTSFLPQIEYPRVRTGMVSEISLRGINLTEQMLIQGPETPDEGAEDIY